jgi:hypothetical protein
MLKPSCQSPPPFHQHIEVILKQISFFLTINFAEEFSVVSVMSTIYCNVQIAHLVSKYCLTIHQGLFQALSSPNDE